MINDGSLTEEILAKSEANYRECEQRQREKINYKNYIGIIMGKLYDSLVMWPCIGRRLPKIRWNTQTTR